MNCSFQELVPITVARLVSLSSLSTVLCQHKHKEVQLQVLKAALGYRYSYVLLLRIYRDSVVRKVEKRLIYTD